MRIIKTIETKIRRTALLLLLPLCALLAGAASAPPASPNDGADAKVMRFDNLRYMRYAEVFLIGVVGDTLEAAFYNTTDLNNSADPGNTCPRLSGTKWIPRR
jgi:hypothetical protein